eukprot:430981-Pleurochrysis_carterae.AAC.2
MATASVVHIRWAFIKTAGVNSFLRRAKPSEGGGVRRTHALMGGKDAPREYTVESRVGVLLAVASGRRRAHCREYEHKTANQRCDARPP